MNGLRPCQDPLDEVVFASDSQMRLYSQLASNLNEHFYIWHKLTKSFKHAKKIGVTLPIYTTSEGQCKIEIYVSLHNETDTGVVNKNEVTVEKKSRKFPQLNAISINLKKLIYS